MLLIYDSSVKKMYLFLISAEREMSSWYLSDSPINKLWRNIDGASHNLLNDQDKVPVIGCLNQA